MTNKSVFIKSFVLAIAFITGSAIFNFASAQWPAYVKPVKIELNKKNTLTGNLSDGITISDLSWASAGNIACFAPKEKAKFTGKHVVYALNIPAKSILNIEVKPVNPQTKLSLYAYTVPANNFSDVVPNIKNCITCEADMRSDFDKNDNGVRNVRVNSVNTPYNVVIVVAGEENMTSGAFTINVEMKQ